MKNYSLNEIASYPEILEIPATMCLRICGITDVSLSLLFRFSPPLTDLYAHAGNTSNYLAYSVAVVGLTPPRRSLVIVVKLKLSHSLMNTTSQSYSARGCTPPRILNPAFDRIDTAARFSLLDSGGSCST